MTETVAPESCVFLVDAYRQLSQINLDYSKISNGYITLIPKAATGSDVAPEFRRLNGKVDDLTGRLDRLNDQAIPAMDECEAASGDSN